MYVQCGSVVVMQMYCLNVKLIEKKKLGLHELVLDFGCRELFGASFLFEKSNSRLVTTSFLFYAFLFNFIYYYFCVCVMIYPKQAKLQEL